MTSLMVLLSGCRRATETVSQFAENTRNSTERMASDSDQSNADREKREDPYIADVRAPPSVKLVERYEARQGPDGIFVYDTETHSIARLDNQATTGLNLKQADDAVDALTAADARGAH
jgi:hypothetical protein